MTTTTNSQPTQEQLDHCTRIIHENTGEVFYKVESETTDDEYEVHFVVGKGFTCTCPAGQQGFANCKSTCKHCRWAFFHAKGIREMQAEQSAIESLVRQGVSRETATRVTYAKGPQFTEAEIKLDQERFQARPFQLMR